MLSTGRAIFASSIRLNGPKVTTYAQQTNKSVQGLFVSSGLQSVRLFSKTNGALARFGGRTVPTVTIQDVGAMRSYGSLAVGAASAAGLGALVYYGLGMSNEEGALERAVLWPQYVRDRIHSTYAHLGTGIGISTAAAYTTFRLPQVMAFFSNCSPMFMIGTMVAVVATGTLVQSIPYEPGLGVKQLAWAGHCSLLGMMLAPLSLLGGPAIIRAATYTAGIVGGLSLIAVTAPSERFLVGTAPIAVGLGAVTASCIGTYFLPPTSRIGLGLYGFAIYGGLILFSGLLLHHTQKTIKKAELHPAYSMAPYDPINNSLHMYMDILNIFLRMVHIVSGGQRK